MNEATESGSKHLTSKRMGWLALMASSELMTGASNLTDLGGSSKCFVALKHIEPKDKSLGTAFSPTFIVCARVSRF